MKEAKGRARARIVLRFLTGVPIIVSVPRGVSIGEWRVSDEAVEEKERLCRTRKTFQPKESRNDKEGIT
jgi:hypothetical protein